jgi:hypothetical protein
VYDRSLDEIIGLEWAAASGGGELLAKEISGIVNLEDFVETAGHMSGRNDEPSLQYFVSRMESPVQSWLTVSFGLQEAVTFRLPEGYVMNAVTRTNGGPLTKWLMAP